MHAIPVVVSGNTFLQSMTVLQTMNNFLNIYIPINTIALNNALH